MQTKRSAKHLICHACPYGCQDQLKCVNIQVVDVGGFGPINDFEKFIGACSMFFFHPLLAIPTINS